MKHRKWIEFFVSTAIGLSLWRFAEVGAVESSIFSALVMVIFLLLEVLSELNVKQGKIISGIDTIDRQIIPVGYKRFKYHKDFYQSLNQQLRNANEEILLTHIRHETPSKYTHGKKYFDNVIGWAKKHPDGAVKRISCRSNSDMSKYCDSQYELSKEVSNYHFKAVEWNSPFPNINFAIIDRRKVFVALSGSVANETAGLFLEDERAASYFKSYFEAVFTKD